MVSRGFYKVPFVFLVLAVGTANSFAAETVVQAEVADSSSKAAPKTEAEKTGPLFQHATYPEAWKAAQKSNRPILIYVCMPNCPHCTKMMEKTYELSHVDKLVRGSFETIHVGRYSHAKLISKLKIKWYPTTVLVSPNNKVLDMIEGYVAAPKFEQRLYTGLANVSGTKVATR